MMLALAVAAPALLVGHGRAPLARRPAVHMAAPEPTPAWAVELRASEFAASKKRSRDTMRAGARAQLAIDGGTALYLHLWPLLWAAGSGGNRFHERDFVS